VAKHRQAKVNHSNLWILTIGVALATLYFNSNIQDPFNSPKLWLIILLSSWLFGHVIANLKSTIVVNKSVLYAVSIFLVSGLISLLLTNPLYTGFFGETQRRNGFLSYLCLSIILVSAMQSIKFTFITRLSFAVIFVGSILSVYGLMQISGLDFVSWNNPYNAVISTVGNPNFAAAIMAIIATLNFGFALVPNFNLVQRLFHVVVFALSFLAIFRSDARQGLVSGAVGIGTIIIIHVHSKFRKVGWFFAFSAFLIGVLSILGMLQKGPLQSILYKDSVSVRGYYWRAGIEMFRDNFLFGIGQDRYGAFFKAYREPQYSLTYGFDITSSNAHNLPIQLFSTGGIFFGGAYLALMGIVLFSAYRGIKKAVGTNRLILSTLFAGWLVYQAQSFISIDNLGIAVWGWLLSGFIIGLSTQITKNELAQSPIKQASRGSIKVLQPVVSGFMSLCAVILVSFLYRGEEAAFQTRIRFNPQDVANNNVILEFASKSLETPLIEPAYKIASMNYLAASGFAEKALEELNKQLTYDPKNLDVLTPIAEINERLNRIPEAIVAREAIRTLDPWNSRNLLQLGREYQFIGDFNKMQEVREAILKFDSVSKESEAARSELVVE
jgi:O-antigen ligase